MAAFKHRKKLIALAALTALVALPLAISRTLRESFTDGLHDARARWFPDRRHPMAGAVFAAKRSLGAIMYDSGQGSKPDPKPIGPGKLADYGPNVIGIVATDTPGAVLVSARERDGGTTFFTLAKSGIGTPKRVGHAPVKVSLATMNKDGVVFFVSGRKVYSTAGHDSDPLGELPDGYPEKRMEVSSDGARVLIFLSRDTQSVTPPFAHRVFVIGPSSLVEVSGLTGSWQVLGTFPGSLALLGDDSGRLFSANLNQGHPVALTPQGLDTRVLSILSTGSVLAVASSARARGSQLPGCEPQVYTGEEAPPYQLGELAADHGVRCWGQPELDVLAVPLDGSGPRTLAAGVDVVTVDQTNQRLAFRDRATSALFDLDLMHAEAKPRALKAAMKEEMHDVIGFAPNGLHVCQTLPFTAPFDHTPRPPRKGGLIADDGSFKAENCLSTLRRLYAVDATKEKPRPPSLSIDPTVEAAVFRVGDDGRPIQLLPWQPTQLNGIRLSEDGSTVVYQENGAQGWLALRTDKPMETTLGARRIAPLSVGVQMRTATDFLGIGRGKIVLHSLGQLFAFPLDGSNVEKGVPLAKAELAKPMHIVSDIDRVIVDGFMPCGNGMGPVTFCTHPPPHQEAESWVTMDGGAGTLTPVLADGMNATFVGFSERYRSAIFLDMDAAAPPSHGTFWRVDFSGAVPGKPAAIATGLDVIPGGSTDLLADRFAVLADHEGYTIVPLGGPRMSEQSRLALPKPILGKESNAVLVEVDPNWIAAGTELWLCLLPREPSESRQPACRISPYTGDHTITTTPDGRIVMIDDLLYSMDSGTPSRIPATNGPVANPVCATDALCAVSVGDGVRTVDLGHATLSSKLVMAGVGAVRLSLNPLRNVVVFDESLAEANGLPGRDFGSLISWAPVDVLAPESKTVPTLLLDDSQVRLALLGWVKAKK